MTNSSTLQSRPVSLEIMVVLIALTGLTGLARLFWIRHFVASSHSWIGSIVGGIFVFCIVYFVCFGLWRGSSGFRRFVIVFAWLTLVQRIVSIYVYLPHYLSNTLELAYTLIWVALPLFIIYALNRRDVKSFFIESKQV